MCTAALFTIAKIWKQSSVQSTDEWIKKMWYICVCRFTHTHKYYSVIKKKNEILPFATMYMDLVGIRLSGVRQRQIPYSFTYMCKQLDCNKKY